MELKPIWFSVQSRNDKDASSLSLHFLIVFDWCISKTLGNRTTGIRWSMLQTTRVYNHQIEQTCRTTIKTTPDCSIYKFKDKYTKKNIITLIDKTRKQPITHKGQGN